MYYTECLLGLFGANCEGLCSSNCNTSGLCDRVSGQCEGGCQAGWFQPKCDAGMKVSQIGSFSVISTYHLHLDVRYLRLAAMFMHYLFCDFDERQAQSTSKLFLLSV